MQPNTLRVALVGAAVAAFLVIGLLLMTGAFNPVTPAEF